MDDEASTEGQEPNLGEREAPATKRLRRGDRAGRQAIVLVHGMGEQIPMDTIKGFARTIWRGDLPWSTVRDDADDIWSKPDPKTGSLELRRLTTRKTPEGGNYPKGVRTDFYELYWADLTAGSTWEQFVSWVRYLLFRSLSKVPVPVRPAWYLLWGLSILAMGLALLSILPEAIWSSIGPDWVRAVVLAIVAALTTIIHQMATKSFGRMVRYTRAQPDNIAARAAVRERGLELLRALHSDDKYDRVILVAHSLGTILAYDLVSYFWAERGEARTFQTSSGSFAALQRLEMAAAALDAVIINERAADAHDRLTLEQCQKIRKSEEYSNFRQAQAELRRAMRNPSRPSANWLISDFLTLGSPLTHAEFLLARDWPDLLARQRQRELPTSPPVREELEPRTLAIARKIGGFPIEEPEEDSRLLSFPTWKNPPQWSLHHGAPFAVVRWTNIFDRSRNVFQGDLISGPLGPSFGPAIDDIDLADIDEPSIRFTHTRYWQESAPPARLRSLREAMNILDD
ncbi:hypothetical protein CN233_25130 [Sinorhizobium meliloti]|uniref:hypothetical protein n=1 Tax=Rhizobium meliloti TaxID=382 RepID=UPI000FDAB0A2|nr:hypothetical protein [Sinorhizobium meliloti]RVG25664.1 hypothetical protein CN233_25130 [Sinorhizobium meliloti]RVK93194.1 hypothetical protein CN152_23630 [Sinorhizobium meliloti]RVN41679.1 hypothetical protein CN113_24890 [Sinorhizobium meliloti]